jgi:glycosyltransferase involved in cell wall biosynthesis
MEQLKVRLAVIRGKDHSLYEEILASPPDGVEYVTDGPAAPEGSAAKGPGFVSVLRRNRVVRAVLDPQFVRALPKPDEPPGGTSFSIARNLTRFAGGSASKGKEAVPFDVLHSAGSSMLENIPWIVERDLRWVVDFEFAASLFGYYGNWRRRVYRERARRMIAKQLSSKYCMKLMPWTDASMRTVESLLPYKEVLAKAEVVRLAIRPAPPKPAGLEKHDRVRILFLGSSNFMGEFYSKGGLDVLESYRKLREKAGDRVELVFRCWMPDELRAKYASTPGLHVISDVLPRDALDRLFWESDIFLFPSHNTPGMAFLEAMRFGLPVVAKDIWANKELVQDGVHGFLVEPSKELKYYLPGNVPNWSMDDGPFLPHMKKTDPRVIDDLVERMMRLVESESLRERMGAAGRKEVEEGKASVSNRNAALRRIYEEAARR